MDMDKVLSFLNMCRVRRLSQQVVIDHVTELYEPCGALQQHVHDVLPYIQAFLYSHHPEIYAKHQENNIAEKLKEMTFGKVGCIR